MGYESGNYRNSGRRARRCSPFGGGAVVCPFCGEARRKADVGLQLERPANGRRDGTVTVSGKDLHWGGNNSRRVAHGAHRTHGESGCDSFGTSGSHSKP